MIHKHLKSKKKLVEKIRKITITAENQVIRRYLRQCKD